jgi:hypothetical protein
LSQAVDVTEARHPDDADLVAFVEPQCRYQSDVMLSAMFRRYRDRAVVIDSQDTPVPVLPGLYACLDARYWNDGRFKGGFYLRVAENTALDPSQWGEVEPLWLFSFVGKSANNRSVRDRVLALRHPRGYVRESSTGQADGSMSYAETLARSRFVLAPCGLGVSTWRLFEAMRIGRCPVIISDNWVAREGVDWDACSIRVREADVADIPDILESRESDALRLGLQAQAEWRRCFSMEGAFGWTCRQLLDCHRIARTSREQGRWSNIVGLRGGLGFLRGALRSAAAGML